MTTTIFPQKYKGTTAEVICSWDFQNLWSYRDYLLGAMHGARAAGNYELEELFSFFHQQAHNLQFCPYAPLHNLTDNTPAKGR